MAWTDPRTWVTDELVTAAMMNAHVRDNFNAVEHLIVRKTADESQTSTTTMQDDDALILPVAANDVWQVRIGLLFSGGAGNLKVQFTFPAGGVIAFSGNANDSTGSWEKKLWLGSSSPSNSDEFLIQGSGAINYQEISGVYVNSSTAGNVTMQWAQVSSSATPTLVKANSTLWGCQLA